MDDQGPSPVAAPDVEVPRNQPAGWYPVDEPPDALRWWDGIAWTEHVAVASAAPRSKRTKVVLFSWYLALTLWGLAALEFGGVTGSRSGAECNLDDTFNSGVFLRLWIAGIALAIVGAFSLRRGRRERNAGTFLVVCAIAAPAVLLVGAAVNCSNY